MADPMPGTKRKRPSRPDKRPQKQGKSSQKPKSTSKRRLRDPSPQPDSEDEIGPGGIESDVKHDLEGEESEQSDIEETPAERRLRLAKDYLKKVAQEACMG